MRTAETRLDRRAEGRLKRPGGRSLSYRLFSPVDIASLVYFQIAFGAETSSASRSPSSAFTWGQVLLSDSSFLLR